MNEKKQKQEASGFVHILKEAFEIVFVLAGIGYGLFLGKFIVTIIEKLTE